MTDSCGQETCFEHIISSLGNHRHDTFTSLRIISLTATAAVPQSCTQLRIRGVVVDDYGGSDDQFVQLEAALGPSEVERICETLRRNRSVQRVEIDPSVFHTEQQVTWFADFINWNAALCSLTLLENSEEEEDDESTRAALYRRKLLKAAYGKPSILSEAAVTSLAALILDEGSYDDGPKIWFYSRQKVLAIKTLELLTSGVRVLNPAPSIPHAWLRFDLRCNEEDGDNREVLAAIAQYIASDHFANSRFCLEVNTKYKVEDGRWDNILLCYRGNNFVDDGKSQSLSVSIQPEDIPILLGTTNDRGDDAHDRDEDDYSLVNTPKASLAFVLESALLPTNAQYKFYGINFWFPHSFGDETWPALCSVIGDPRYQLEGIGGLWCKHPRRFEDEGEVPPSVSYIPINYIGDDGVEKERAITANFFTAMEGNKTLTQVEWRFLDHGDADVRRFQNKVAYYTSRNRIFANSHIWTGDGANHEWTSALLQSHGEVANLSLIYYLISNKPAALEDAVWH